ncbi:D-alanyl-lipoteichoic acid acyltransferase DltB, MBOAT superfamily [Cognatiyoonia koreensis]|uniref:Probable alginate O-acetylase AlgI n=1 Tax=Cognatiyoonia koreensis TaxID=364200 RepID=A0A1I0RSH4_9RHOB|nr:MBOAT family O-acyltransferase [Cognatiyoonia koreensis]SEW44315.1 D-alanyl-lipoteichoic acid acyltransferase DltB, MBOAT superfamily [Cognatiyoonia koreensis]
MLFTTLSFWGFFAIVGLAYVLLSHKAQNRMLLVASYIFYGAWDWRFLSLILLSTLVDYFVGLAMERETRETRRKRLLYVSLACNLGMLAVFKYLGFFVDSFAGLLAGFGYEADIFTLSIVLPVGISFYTFQTLSYTIDIYRKELKPTDDFLDFALFVAFFPQLVAGPIERARNLLPNIAKPRILSWEALSRGVVLVLIGLIKKVVIADAIGPSVDAVYSSPDPTRLDIVFATWLFAIQIYCDFSGYTDIARGVAKMLGFSLMRNFAQPYFAADPQEFWRRWHISLSTWLRDYLYISLGGNRGGPTKTYRNLMATMTLGGLWHGAAWNFVLWGIYQGALLSIHRALTGRNGHSGEGTNRTFWSWLKRAFAIAAFFQIVCYGWLLFRATSFSQISDFTGKLLGLSAAPMGLTMPMPPFPALLGMVFLFVWDMFTERTGNVRFYSGWPLVSRAALWACMIYLFAFGATTTTSSFIYFQF